MSCSVEDVSAAERESWVDVCAQSLVMLRTVCLSHPNQRKVYVSVLERLFIPLLPYCGPQGMAPVKQSEWQKWLALSRGHCRGRGLKETTCLMIKANSSMNGARCE